MIKPLILITAVVLLASPSAPAYPLQDDASAQSSAKLLYERDCIMCHGANGDGKTAIAKDRQLVLSDWTDPKTLSSRPDQLLFNLIRHGKGKMPAESAGRASKDEVNSLIHYIRSIASVHPSTQPAANTPTAPNK
jgi:mono/diheme cytochrome c family protein